MSDEKAVPHLQHAIELDPNFAMAYATLGVVRGNLSQTKQQLENLSKAFELKDRASEREKLYISAHYYSEVTGEIDKALAIYERWKQTYPRDNVPWDNLAQRYESIGQPERSLINASEVMRLDPKGRFAYQNLADAYRLSAATTKPRRFLSRPRGTKSDVALRFRRPLPTGFLAGR